MSIRIPREMACWQAFSYVKPGQRFQGSLTFNKTRFVPPLTSANQVLLKVQKASINPIDAAMLRGYGNEAFQMFYNFSKFIHDPSNEITSQLPIVPGRDYLGQVVDIGPNIKGDALKLGDILVGSSFPFMSGLNGGSLSQYIICNYEDAVRVDSEEIDTSELVSLPYAGLTAWAALEDSASINVTNNLNKPRMSILIPGASGLVGYIALQLAKRSNAFARIDTVIPNDEQAIGMLNVLKTKKIINNVYTTDDLEEINQKYDVIIDCVKRSTHKDEDAIIKKLSPEGRYVTLNQPLLRLQDEKGLLLGSTEAFLHVVQKNMTMNRFNPLCPGYAWAFYRSSKTRLGHLVNWFKAGDLFLSPIKTLPLEQADQGFDMISDPKHFGKVVINID